MKKKYIATLVAIMLLSGCGTPAPAAPSTTDEPDMEAIIQRSVDEAVQEKLKEYEEEQKKKDEEIAKLKEQLEDLTAQSEAPPEENSSTPDEGASSQAPASSQPVAPASSSQPEIPPQPEPEPPPQSAPAPTKQPAKAKPINEGTAFEGYEVKVNDWTTPAVTSSSKDWPVTSWYFYSQSGSILGSISGTALMAITERTAQTIGYDVDWSLWLAEAFNEYRNVAGGGSTSSAESPLDEPEEDASSQQDETSQENDALAVIRLVNKERETAGQEPLKVDEDLMELAQIRAKELSKKFSHERPDGTEVVDLGYGENIARGQSSASEVMRDWMKSEGHRYNILWDQYHSIGVARSGSYWVQVFSF